MLFVETQYKMRIQIFKRDGERTLGRAYKKWIKKKGIRKKYLHRNRQNRIGPLSHGGAARQ